MVDVLIRKDVYSQGGKSVDLKRNEKFLILKGPMRGPGGKDFYIVRNSKGLEGEVAKNSLGNLELPDWFQMVDRRAAETQLKNSSPGKFLIRPTTQGKDGEFSVSVKYNKPGDVHHFKLIKESRNQTWTMWGQKFETLQEFVKNFQIRAIAKKGPEQIHLDKNANVEVISVEDKDDMDTYVDKDDIYEDEDSSESNDEEERNEEETNDVRNRHRDGDEQDEENSDEEHNDIMEGSVVRCTFDFIADEDGTISVSRGDRLMVLYPPTEGWVYVRKENEDEGYVPEENTECERR
eukprot:GFUD01013381.1.p1 GENE.GFUD01013381.1~~GFUD01013381.1.p1  ORF type:complete len:292 (-),score=96.90 GFUD01013381.1:180-1055(-)